MDQESRGIDSISYRKGQRQRDRKRFGYTARERLQILWRLIAFIFQTWKLSKKNVRR